MPLTTAFYPYIVLCHRAAPVSRVAATRLPAAVSKIRKRRSPRRIYLELPHHAESISKHPWCQGNLVIEEKGKVSLPGSLAMKQPLTDSVLPSSREGSPAWLPKSLPVVSPRMSGQIHNATDGTGSLRLEEHIGPREDSELDSEEGGTPFHVKL